MRPGWTPYPGSPGLYCYGRLWPFARVNFRGAWYRKYLTRDGGIGFVCGDCATVEEAMIAAEQRAPDEAD